MNLASIRINPISAVTPEDFQKDCDQALVLLALPHESPSIRVALIFRNSNQFLERLRRRRHQILSVVKQSGICERGHPIESPTIGSTADVGREKIVAVRWGDPVREVQ